MKYGSAFSWQDSENLHFPGQATVFPTAADLARLGNLASSLHIYLTASLQVCNIAPYTFTSLHFIIPPSPPPILCAATFFNGDHQALFSLEASSWG